MIEKIIVVYLNLTIYKFVTYLTSFVSSHLLFHLFPIVKHVNRFIHLSFIDPFILLFIHLAITSHPYFILFDSIPLNNQNNCLTNTKYIITCVYPIPLMGSHEL